MYTFDGSSDERNPLYLLLFGMKFDTKVKGEIYMKKTKIKLHLRDDSTTTLLPLSIMFFIKCYTSLTFWNTLLTYKNMPYN